MTARFRYWSVSARRPSILDCQEHSSRTSGSIAVVRPRCNRPLPVIQAARRSPRQRPVSEAAIGPTAARRCSFSKAVAHDLAALVGTRCRPYVRSSNRRTGRADPLCEFNSGSTGVSDVTQTGLSLDGSLWQNTGRLRAFATGRFPTDDPRRTSRCRYLERRSIATGDALQAHARSPA